MSFLTVGLCLSKVLIPGLAEGPIKRKKILSPEELEDRQKKRQEAAAKRKKLMEEKKKAKEEAEHRNVGVLGLDMTNICCIPVQKLSKNKCFSPRNGL